MAWLYQPLPAAASPEAAAAADPFLNAVGIAPDARRVRAVTSWVAVNLLVTTLAVVASTDQVRAATYQQAKAQRPVSALQVPNLLTSTLAPIVVAPPVVPNAQASAPQYRWQNADTSAGMAQVLRTVVPPVIVAPHDAPDKSKWQPSDSSRGVPKALYADAQLPVQNAPHTQPDRRRPVVDTSQKQPVTLQVIAVPAPPTNAPQFGPVRAVRNLADTSASTPKPLYADVVPDTTVLRAPTYQQGKTRPAVVALQYPNLAVSVAPPAVDPFRPTPTVQQVQARPRMPVISCPPSLKAGPLGNSYSIRLEWTDITGEDGYRVKWGWTSGNYAQTRDVAADVTSYDIDGLPLYQNVYWVVCSMLGGVEQTCTTEVGLTVGRGHTPTTGHIVLTGHVPTVTQGTAPIRPPVHTAPDRLRPVVDTSRSQPVTLQVIVAPAPLVNAPSFAALRHPTLPADTSRSTPKPLYADAVAPFANLQHTAPDRVRPVADTSRGQPITLQAAVVPPPPFTLPHHAPIRYRHGLEDTSASVPKTLYDDAPVIPPVVVVPEEPGGGWEHLFRQRDVPQRVREVLEAEADAEVARRAAKRLEAASDAVARQEQADAEAAEDALDWLEARFSEQALAWDAGYIELLRQIIAAQEAARLEAIRQAELAEAARVAELLALEAARVARNNENARRVLLMLAMDK